MNTQRAEDIERITNYVGRNISNHYKEITSYTHLDYKEMKEDLGWFNKDIADIVGFEHMSVKNQTQPKYDLPIWAQVLVFLWKQENEGQVSEGNVSKRIIDNLTTFKAAYKEAKEELKELNKKVDFLEKEVRKAQRKEKQRIKFIEQLDSLENDSGITIDKNNLTPAVIKTHLGKAARKHRRKLSILTRLKATIDSDSVPVAITPVKPTTKRNTTKTKKK